MKGVIDYIFYSKTHMNVLGVLGPLDPQWLVENNITGCPHPHIPSDHFSLLTQLELHPPLLPLVNGVHLPNRRGSTAQPEAGLMAGQRSSSGGSLSCLHGSSKERQAKHQGASRWLCVPRLHPLTERSDWGQCQQQVEQGHAVSGVIAPQEQGEVEKPSGRIGAGSHRSHPLTALSHWGCTRHSSRCKRRLQHWQQSGTLRGGRRPGDQGKATPITPLLLPLRQRKPRPALVT
ncbi:hypothetical protein QTO34_008267 [Cnephaeus nilssonii]|uniref:Uncharacterized protein n=1 Tax=Cnephaeus nilssonii TaxID=3371016 RepID=A0AA40IA13_CNENI|nr:hypothetical protein QTO34_008267 [Eptesicus nilssonii]